MTALVQAALEGKLKIASYKLVWRRHDESAFAPSLPGARRFSDSDVDTNQPAARTSLLVAPSSIPLIFILHETTHLIGTQLCWTAVLETSSSFLTERR